MCKHTDVFLPAVRLCFCVAFLNPGLRAENHSPPPVSSVQIINATSVDRIDLAISGFQKYPALLQGSRISGGAFSNTDWAFVMSPISSGAADLSFSSRFHADPNESYTVVLIGDFLKTKNLHDGKDNLRADILEFAHRFNESEKPNRMVVVNGLPKTPLTIEIPGFEAKTIQPMKSETWSGLSRSVSPVALAGDSRIPFPMEFTPPVNGGVIAFFQKGDTFSYSLMPQKSLGD